MLRNPELRKLLLIAAPVCAVFTAVCLVLDTTSGILTGVLSVLLLSLYLLDVRRRYRTMARLAEDIRNHRYSVHSSVTTDYPREIDALAEQVAGMEKAVADSLLLSPEEKKHISAYLKDIYKSMAFLRQDLLKLES